MDLDVMGLGVFPLSLTGEAAMWFTELPYNSIFTWNQLRDVFLSCYYPVSKKLNHKDRVNNFAVQSTNNLVTDEIREEMAYMKSELGLVLKHVTGVQKR